MNKNKGEKNSMKNKTGKNIIVMVTLIMLFILSACSSWTTATPPNIAVSAIPTRTNQQKIQVVASVSEERQTDKEFSWEMFVDGQQVLSTGGKTIEKALSLSEGSHLLRINVREFREGETTPITTWEQTTFVDTKPPMLENPGLLIAKVTEQGQIKIETALFEEGSGVKGIYIGHFFAEAKKETDIPNYYTATLLIPFEAVNAKMVTVVAEDEVGNVASYQTTLAMPQSYWERRDVDQTLKQIIITPNYNPFDINIVGFQQWFWGYEGDTWQLYVNRQPQGAPQTDIDYWWILRWVIVVGIPLIIITMIVGVFVRLQYIHQKKQNQIKENIGNRVNQVVEVASANALARWNPTQPNGSNWENLFTQLGQKYPDLGQQLVKAINSLKEEEGEN